MLNVDSVKDYTVVYGSDTDELIDNVNLWIRYGYVPIGGIAVQKNNGIPEDTDYYQAMVKPLRQQKREKEQNEKEELCR